VSFASGYVKEVAGGTGGYGIHLGAQANSAFARDYVASTASTAGRIKLQFLRGYAPELNPVE